MGVGHVPTGSVPRARAGAHFPRCERGRARKVRAQTLTGRRRSIGEAGERLAAWFLESHGLTVVETNVRVGRGEVDLLARDGRRRVVAEVRTVTSRVDPLDAVDIVKQRRVESLGSRLGADRVDYIGVGLRPEGVDFHWLPGPS